MKIARLINIKLLVFLFPDVAITQYCYSYHLGHLLLLVHHYYVLWLAITSLSLLSGNATGSLRSHYQQGHN